VTGRACGGYDSKGLACDPCRADGWTDTYSIVEDQTISRKTVSAQLNTI
jgi:hypothetical protein